VSVWLLLPSFRQHGIIENLSRQAEITEIGGYRCSTFACTWSACQIEMDGLMRKIKGLLWLPLFVVGFAAFVATAQSLDVVSEKSMKLEELVQKLSDVYPWTFDNVSGVLGQNLFERERTPDITIYSVSSLSYEEGLLIKSVELRLDTETLDTVRLILNLGDDAACFTLDRIKKTYPKLVIVGMPNGAPGRETYFAAKTSWGSIGFGFKEKRRECLATVGFVPAAWK
jgi:hypothetical protein